MNDSLTPGPVRVFRKRKKRWYCNACGKPVRIKEPDPPCNCIPDVFSNA